MRNCPWVGSLWAAALRAMERTGAPDEQHAALAEKALAAGMQVRQPIVKLAPDSVHYRLAEHFLQSIAMQLCMCDGFVLCWAACSSLP